jgi:hypothetical protein
MNHSTISAHAFDLQPGATLGLAHAAGRELIVFSGRLWLTCTGCTEDVFLSAGDRVRVAADAVIECDSPGAARLQLLPAQGRLARGAARLLSALGRLALRLQGLRPVDRSGRLCRRA